MSGDHACLHHYDESNTCRKCGRPTDPVQAAKLWMLQHDLCIADEQRIYEARDLIGWLVELLD